MTDTVIAQAAETPTLSDSLAAAAIDRDTADRVVRAQPRLSGSLEVDREAFGGFWRLAQSVLDRLPAKPQRDRAAAGAAAAIHAAARRARSDFLDAHIDTLYRRLTDDLRKPVRLERLIYDAADAVPGLVPTEAAIGVEMARRHADKEGIEVDQGLFVGRIMARQALAFHLCHAMTLPKPESLDRLAAFRRDGTADFGRARVDRRGAIAHVSLTHPLTLNAEDDSTLEPFENAVDLALLDPDSKICVLRGGPIPHAKYAGRRVFSSGLNLTDLYYGRISYLFYLVRDMGMLNKIYRGLSAADAQDETLGRGTEKLWIAAVEGFAIGGGCQLLLVMDCTLAERGAYLTLPARKEGIIPGMANLRLPRFVGDRIARQAIMAERRIECDSDVGRMICDEIVAPGEMDAAIERAAANLTGSGVVSAAGNRRAFRIMQEPLELFCRYLSVYAPEQALCHTSPALIANLERFWEAASRTPKTA